MMAGGQKKIEKALAEKTRALSILDYDGRWQILPPTC
jgi:hypothetical protein